MPEAAVAFKSATASVILAAAEANGMRCGELRENSFQTRSLFRKDERSFREPGLFAPRRKTHG
jgi:hypothetical protein